MGLTEQNVADNVLVFSAPAFNHSQLLAQPEEWGLYSIAVQTPQYKINSLNALNNIPINSPTATSPQLFENLATMSRTSEPSVVTHYNVHPVIDIYGSVQGRDPGGVAKDVQRFTDAARKTLPRGSTLVIRGQVVTMHSSFIGLFVGPAFAIALVYILLVVNFQSWTEAFIIITALPGALAGICWMLFFTGTHLTVPALMGTIMSIGVATANSVLVITFANERLELCKDSFKAALEAGATRLRPVMMTTMAMIIGIIPMAPGLGDGGNKTLR